MWEREENTIYTRIECHLFPVKLLDILYSVAISDVRKTNSVLYCCKTRSVL
jgi:hypothetical protein